MMKRALGEGGPVRLALACFLLASACGGDDAGDLSVTVSFESQAAEMNTATIHVWAVKEIVRTDPAPTEPLVTCNRLVGGIVDPYDQNVERRADQVFFMPLAGPAVIKEVSGGSALIYVEGVDQVGRIHLAGCTQGSVPGSASVALATSGVFDCADPATEDGARCDDGLLCTMDERCNGGTCGGGTPLNCAFVADACHGSNCVEGTGCVPVPLPNGEPCDDGLFCTENDACQEGMCRGADRDCATELGTGPCELALCNQSFGCYRQDAPPTTPCDDNDMCTTTSMCDDFGFCDGTPDVMCPVADTCNNASYCLSSTGCVHNPLSTPLIYCTADANPCTEAYPYNASAGAGADSCSPYMAGMRRTCLAGRPKDRDNDGYVDATCTTTNGDCNDNNNTVFPGGMETAATGTTCSDGLDNDCDGQQDCNDVLCCGGIACPSAPENTPTNCSDTRDNDCDGMIDCVDTNCAGVGSCP